MGDTPREAEGVALMLPSPERAPSAVVCRFFSPARALQREHHGFSPVRRSSSSQPGSSGDQTANLLEPKVTRTPLHAYRITREEGDATGDTRSLLSGPEYATALVSRVTLLVAVSRVACIGIENPGTSVLVTR